MPGSFPRLEKFSSFCRWVIALIGIVGGALFAIWLGRLAEHEHSWVGVFWAAVVGLCFMLGGLSYIWKALSLPFYYFLSVLMWVWFASMVYERYRARAPVRASSLILSGVLGVAAVFYLIGHHKARKDRPAAFSFWWWMGPRN